MTAGWTETTLGEVADIVSGATPSTSETAYWDGDLCWATPKDLSELESAEISDTARKITDAGLRSCSASPLPANSVLLSSRAPIGLVAINTVPMATNQGFKSLVPDRRRVDPKFLYWWLRKSRPLLESLGNGATFKEISKKTTSAVPILLPPLDEQRRIASILDAADALRTKRRQALEKLDSLAQSIFINMFGDLHIGPGGGCALTDLADLQVGYAFKSSTFTTDGSGVRICRGINVLPGEVSWRATERVPDHIAGDRAAFALEEGDVVIAMDRPWIGSGFKAAKVSASDVGALLVQRVARLRSLGEVPPALLYELIRLPAFSRHCAPTETTIPHISPNDFRSFELERPDPRQASVFAEAVDHLEQIRLLAARQASGAEQLFVSLQHRAFRGEL